MRTRSGYSYQSPAVGDTRENCKRKRQMMNGKRLQPEPTGVNHFDDLPDEVLISVLAKLSTTTKYAKEFVNVISRKRQMMNGKRLQPEPTGVNHFDDLPDEVLISVLAKLSTTTKYAKEFVNVILTCKRFNTLGLHLLVLPQEKAYQRLQNLKDMYFPEIKELYLKLSTKCEQPMATDQFEKLTHYKNTLRRMMQYFQVHKSIIPPGFNEDKVDAFEKQIQAILNSFKQRKSAWQQKQGQ